MKTSELFKNKRVLSFEIFPPKRTSPIETVYKALDGLKGLSPDFISVTYGAGGSDNSDLTLRVAGDIKSKYGIESVAHLPCINLTKAEVLLMLDKMKELGIENILALRGDIVPDVEPKLDFKHASDLVAFIAEHGDFDIAGACYPEGHTQSANMIEDIKNLKIKVDAGVSHLITQVFFDNAFFYDFLEKARIAGINVPVEAGIMPVTNSKQIKRMVSLCGASLPKKFMRAIERYEDHPEALRDAGIAYAVNQIADLAANGVEGIHIYVMNNPYVAKRICEATESLIAVRD